MHDPIALAAVVLVAAALAAWREWHWRRVNGALWDTLDVQRAHIRRLRQFIRARADRDHAAQDAAPVES